MADHAHNLRARFHADATTPVGGITRGTTNHNRLRRSDRWTANHPRIREVLRLAEHPLAVDVGYGASHTTTVEWTRWLRTVRSDVTFTGLEIDPARVLPPRDSVTFGLGGFELAGLRPHLVRAFNVLRQYDVAHVHDAWDTVTSRLAPSGYFIEGTCDELSRRATWILLNGHGPQPLPFAWAPFDIARPSDLAERLPKALIHRNISGEPLHHIFSLLDAAWYRCAAWSPYGPRVRWRQAHKLLRAEGLPIAPQRRPLRDNTITLPWSAVT